HGYRPSFATGTVAGSSVLGMLIPPSLLLIIYGVLAEVSIGKMFMAGLVPGLILALSFALMIVLAAWLAPGLVFDAAKLREKHAAQSMAPRLGARGLIAKGLPIVVLVGAVIGGLYSGFFTPTEAGGVGAFAALVVALLRRSLGQGRLWKVLTETGAVSVSILMLLVAAGFYGQMLAVAGVPSAIEGFVREIGLGPTGFLLVYRLRVLLLGRILDSSSILLIVVPIAAPIAQSLGFDLVHFGILTVIAVEVGLLTPPFGISVFTIHAALGDRRVSLESIFAGALPFIGVMLAVLALLAAVPALVVY
ncbi:MAG: TRAP transporter large permease subunit, partial [Rhodobacterales bacterium]|nr:TRAP transporter large permease subunit [Rhodobacterales bacterium]